MVEKVFPGGVQEMLGVVDRIVAESMPDPIPIFAEAIRELHQNLLALREYANGLEKRVANLEKSDG